MASEQYATYFEEPKSLAKDREATVGYDGNPSNISMRSQKIGGFTPADPLFDRSVDEIRRDNVIYTSGQVVKTQGVDDNDTYYPDYTHVTALGNPTAVKQTGDSYPAEKRFKRSNFMPHSIKAVFKQDSSDRVFLKSFSVEESEFEIVECAEVTNDASACHVIDLNRAEMTRQAIDNKHGSPTDDHYNPLGRSVSEATKVMQLLMDMSDTCGAITASAVRHALKQRMYYLNRTGKDGISEIIPAVDALYGHLDVYNDSKAIPTSGGEAPYYFKELNNRGSAAILLNVFDSVKKFKTKADLVNQPRGLKLPLQTGMNNLGPHTCKKEFKAALDSLEVFSTIDRGYDPSAPICINDGLAYVIPYSWKTALEFTRSAYGMPRSYTSRVFAYAYQAGKGNQKYIIKVGEPILNGIAWFLEQYASSIYGALKHDSDKEATLYIPVRSYTTHFSLFDYLICAASAYILYERTIAFKDLLDYKEIEGSWPIQGSEPIDPEWVMRNAHGKLNLFDRLPSGEMSPAKAMRWLFPEVFTPIGKDQLLPWYMASSNFTSGGTTDAPTLTQDFDNKYIPAPVIRSGVALGYLDDFYSMTLKDQLLSIDKLVRVPGVTGSFAGYSYAYSDFGEGIAVYKGDPSGIFNVYNFFTTPRQIGWISDAPEGVCKTPIWAMGTDLKDSWFTGKNIEACALNHSSFIARIYSSLAGNSPTSLAVGGNMAVSRASAFAQKWTQIYSSHKSTSGDGNGVIMSAASCFTRDNDDIKLVLNKTMFKPARNTYGAYAEYDNQVPIAAMMRMLWARIQKLPFIINPFDSGAVDNDQIGIVDPFDFAYMFGLAGFMQVSYHEELSNRISEKLAKMYLFLEDPYFKDSPLFKS